MAKKAAKKAVKKAAPKKAAPKKAAPKKAVAKAPAKKAVKKKVAAPKGPLTQTQIITSLADKADLNKTVVKSLLVDLAELAVTQTKKNGAFTVPGLGKLVLSKRKARMGRNPATGAAIKIPASKTVKFRVSKATKDSIVPPKPKK